VDGLTVHTRQVGKEVKHMTIKKTVQRDSGAAPVVDAYPVVSVVS